MRLVFALVLLLGIGLAGTAVYMAQGYIAQIQVDRDRLAEEKARAPRLTQVVVAKRTLRYGERISQLDVQVIKWPVDQLPPGAFQYVEQVEGAPPEAAFMFGKGENRLRAVLRSYEKFEPILASKVTEPGLDAGITSNLTPGMRAFAIRVDVTSGVSGFLRPGDRVDVYWSGQIGNQAITKLIGTNVRLIAIDQSTDADRAEETLIARTVTVEGTPEQVAGLTLAQSTGALTLSLVGSGDLSQATPIEVNRDQLLGITPEVVVAPEVEKVCTIRTNRGGEMVVVEIPCQ